MKLGEAFLSPSHGHVCFVVSHPDPATGEVVVVNITTWEVDKDHACVIEAGRHPKVTHKSVIAYSFAVTLDPGQQATGEAEFQACPPLDPELLDEIQASFEESEYAPQKCVKLVKASAKRQRAEKQAAAKAPAEME